VVKIQIAEKHPAGVKQAAEKPRMESENRDKRSAGAKQAAEKGFVWGQNP